MSWRCWPVVLAGLVLTACAGSSGDGPSTSVAVTTASAPPPTPAPTSTVGTVAPTVDGPGTTATEPPATGVAPVGFDLVAGRVTAADGTTCDVCLWLAATAEARSRGLMGVTDLSGADGMVFRWDDATAGSFWMRDTPLPLSIAFFGADGSFVSSADMAPCLEPTPDADCARYGAAGPYRYAVEVASGGLPALLMTTGSRLELLAAACPRSP